MSAEDENKMSENKNNSPDKEDFMTYVQSLVEGKIVQAYSESGLTDVSPGVFAGIYLQGLNAGFGIAANMLAKCGGSQFNESTS